MNVIKLAQEAGMRWEGGFTRVIECVTEAELTRFAALVRAAALEEAARGAPSRFCSLARGKSA